jgi:hypothetical protein
LAFVHAVTNLILESGGTIRPRKSRDKRSGPFRETQAGLLFQVGDPAIQRISRLDTRFGFQRALSITHFAIPRKRISGDGCQPNVALEMVWCLRQ